MNEMTSIVPRTRTGDVLGAVRALLPEIAARADETEAGGRVPADLLDKLQAAGAFRMGLPAIFGGEQLSLSEVNQVIEEVAGADASVAWHLIVSVGSQVIISRLPMSSLQEFYSGGPDMWPKAAVTPRGIATPVEGGYRLSGRWSLASGARDFDWISLGFLIKDENGVRMGSKGKPDIRFCLVPRGDVKVFETWDAVGLRGTRSDDLEVHDLFVPEAWQAPFFGPSQVSGPLLGISMPWPIGPNHSAVVKGVLKAAVADLAKASLGRKPAYNPTVLMKDDPVFNSRFGEIAIRVEALCTLADDCVDMLEQCDCEGRDVEPVEAAKLAAAETLIHHEGTALMDQIMMLAGSTSVYATSGQQRRWRDLRCAAQHMAANIGNYGMFAGALVERAIASTPAKAPARAAA